MNDVVKRRRPAVAALLSLLLVGLGQLYCGRPARAIAWVLAAVLTSASFTLLSILGRISANDPILFLGPLAAGMIIAIVAAIDAWRLARRVSPLRLRWYSRWYILVLALLLVDAPVTAWQMHIYRSFYIPSASMVPTLLPGDRFIVFKTAYENVGPQPGDIIIVAKDGQFYVKRVVGLAGDHVQMIDGRLVINDAQTGREALGDFVFDGEHKSLYRESLPNGRSYRIIERSDHEFLDFTNEITVPEGALFVMGDNRDNSMDSRVPAFGLVPVKNVVGRALFLFWSGDLIRIFSKLE